jgi:putative transposase
VVFVTKYRREVLSKLAIRDLAVIFAKVCQDFGAKLVECNSEDDHMHLRVEISAAGVDLAAGQQPKERLLAPPAGVAPEIEGALGPPCYFAASCGGAPITIVRKYVEQQRRAAPPPRPKGRGFRRRRIG